MYKKRTGPRLLVSLIALIGILISGGFWLTYRESRQEQLNQQLIQAIKKEDADATLMALNAGADPNAHDSPDTSPSFWNVLLSQIEHIRHPRASGLDAPSALLIAVAGEEPSDYHGGSGPFRLANQTIVENLLQRGAKVNVHYTGSTPLGNAAWDEDAPSVRALLRYGADPYFQEIPGYCGLVEQGGINFVLKVKREMEHP